VRLPLWLDVESDASLVEAEVVVSVSVSVSVSVADALAEALSRPEERVVWQYRVVERDEVSVSLAPPSLSSLSDAPFDDAKLDFALAYPPPFRTAELSSSAPTLNPPSTVFTASPPPAAMAVALKTAAAQRASRT